MASNIRQHDDKVSVYTSNGTELVGTFYDNPSSDTGILLFPGFTEHRSSLEETAKKLNSHFKAWTFDINSQGESTGDWDLRQMQDDVYHAQKVIRNRYGLKAVGAFGNSIGAMAVGITAAKDADCLDAICLTSAPAGLQDIVPGVGRAVLKCIPQFLVRYGTILNDKFEASRNEVYRKLSHRHFKTDSGYMPYAQIGATKIPSVRKMMQWIDNAPRLDQHVKDIEQPVMFICGGEDKLLGIRDSELPERLQKMYEITGSRNKSILIVDGADHSINSTTKTDDCFNQDPELQSVKEEILNHFGQYLL